MPIYEYSCPTCGHRFEKLQSMSATGADCPHCEQPAKRAISVFAAVSKGDGFASDMADLGGSPMRPRWAAATATAVSAAAATDQPRR